MLAVASTFATAASATAAMKKTRVMLEVRAMIQVLFEETTKKGWRQQGCRRGPLPAGGRNAFNGEAHKDLLYPLQAA